MARTITVTGQGIERVATTLVQVQLGIEVQGKDAAEVQRQVAKQSTAVVDFLRSRQVEKLETAGIQLQPNYDYNNRERRLVGYLGRNSLQFRLKVQDIGSLLDEAISKGANRLDRISFTATEEAIATAQKEALRRAALEAQQQADAVLQALNFTAKEVVSIKVGSASSPQPQHLSAEYANGAAAATPVIAREQEVRASVTLEISY